MGMLSDWRRLFGKRTWPRLPAVTLIGNPFDSIGRSQHLRATWRALAAAGVHAKVHDVYAIEPERAVRRQMTHARVKRVGPGIRVFHLNGNEIARAIDRLQASAPDFLSTGYNIVAPVWELPRYPQHWADQLDRFHEIWVPTRFVESSIRPRVSVPVVHMRNACEPHVGRRLGRARFGIPTKAFAILYFFDLRSFVARKNPFAAVKAFEVLWRKRGHAPLHLVLKLNYGETDGRVAAQLRDAVAPFRDKVTIIAATLTDNETKNLVRCCDCFLSLHRSEGFGRGPAEAMFFGKPVVATGWSGNMDYMVDGAAFAVPYTLIPVQQGEYIEHEDQVWADPSVDDAVDMLVRLVDDPRVARETGERAQAYMKRHYSDGAIGLDLRRRLEAIAGSIGTPATG